MKRTALFLVVLLLFNSCYTYKPLNLVEDDFIIGQKYEIRIAGREKRRVTVQEVRDSAVLVVHGKTELVVQKSMITESRKMDFSTGKTILASVLGTAALLGTIALFAFKDGIVDGDFLNGAEQD